MKSSPAVLVIATRNRHKTDEIRAILSEGFQCRSLNDFPDAPPVIEDAPTFAANAAKKAVQLAEWIVGASTLRPADPHPGPLPPDGRGRMVRRLLVHPAVLSVKVRLSIRDRRARRPPSQGFPRTLDTIPC